MAIVVTPIVVTPIIDALIIVPGGVGIVTGGRMFCTVTTDITPCRITRAGADIIVAAVAGRAVRGAAASIERIIQAEGELARAYFEQGEAPLAVPVMTSNACFAEA